ncbi:tetratricopeptide repeat protein [Geomonas subterranea]|uniref:Tetratricopeptide repeat protein n=1 Tax=Geomonas subterranea TaxID=2847989 RepID=A0ABX8LEC6_9BACT|nr:tetratricopeptide repeat protein [Geomonas subterranea]QXE90352.1 tetratricopeptide repeat protein [Geomonas subterranea]QXM07521.1 tetratricopeptide repeat protein [Geomonas subterranea]
MTESQSLKELFAAANALFASGDLSRAAERYRRVLQLDPYFAQASFNLGCTLERLCGPGEALPHFERAAQLVPQWSEAHGNLGFALARVGRMEEAAGELQEACRLAPDHAGYRNNLGLALSALGRGEEAQASFQEAIRLDPRYPEPHSNLAILYERFGNGAAAIESLRQALRLRPDYPEAHHNLANALKSQGRHEEAIAHYREALRLKPDYLEAQSSLLFALLYGTHVAEETVFAEHAAFGASQRRAVKPHANVPDPDRVLTIGYVSADFREHAVARFIAPVLSHHDRSRFRVLCYSNVAVPDGKSSELAERCDRFVNIAGLPDDQAEELLREDGIDILVDLSGHSAGNRLPLFARKPAPVQVTWIGYPFSTGLTGIDYRISDAICDPPGETERYHSEELIRLPGTFSCFAPPGDAPAVAPLPCLASGGITFGSFNNPAKITGETLAMWGDVLRAVPGSRLLLKGYSLACPQGRQRFLDAFTAAGIDSERLELIGNTPSYRDHLALYGRVDIALDTFPYNGTTTTCEALWMGVPVVTLAGSTHRSRVGATLLHSVGLDALVAHDGRSFVQIAHALALDRHRLRGLRETLRATMAAASLTDGAGFTRGLEQELLAAWGRWCRRHVPPAADPKQEGLDLLREGRLDAALRRFLEPLRAGDKSTLTEIQDTLNAQTATDQARALTREEGREEESPAEGIASETLAECAELLGSAGFVTPADLICRYLGDRGYQSPRVSRTLGAVALAIGQPGAAAAALSRALEQGDDSRATRILLVKAQQAAELPPQRPQGERLLLIKAWGYGFWSDVNHVLGQLLAAEMTGRSPVVHWGTNSLFSDDPLENAFNNFFEPVSQVTINDVISRRRSFYPPKWQRDNVRHENLAKFDGPWSRCSALWNLERNEEVVVSDFHYAVNDLAPWIPAGHPLHGRSTEEIYLYLFDRYLKVQPRILERVEAFYRQQLAGAPVVGLHVRGGDKVGEDPGLARLNALYLPELERLLRETPQARIFLSTDDDRILARYRERFGSRLVYTVSTRTANVQGVHYQKQASRRALGEEVLIDTLLAARCDRFLGNGLSNVSLAVAQMRRWTPGTCRLFGTRLDYLRQLTLYRS